MNKKQLYESIMRNVSAEIKKVLNETTLSLDDKINMWHDGSRKINIKACSDEKLLNYYNLCCDKGYALEANIIYSEAISRDLDINDMFFNVKPILSAKQICQYIEQHTNSIGDSGEDLFKFGKEGDIVYYCWSCGLNGEMDDYDCMINFNDNTIEILGEILNISDTDNVIYSINNELFEC